MNGSMEQGSDRGNNSDDVGGLIKLVGAREAVPVDRFERARQKVHTHWEQVATEQRTAKHKKRSKLLALVASVAVAFAGGAYVLWSLPLTPQADSLASVDRVLGEVLIAGSVADKQSVLDADSPIVTSSDSRIALRLSGGQSLRIDSMSHVTLHSPNHISLQAGAIYIDTAFAAKDEQITVSTPLGIARDIGTQFQVRMTAAKLLVGVRHGLVEVYQPNKQGLSVDQGHYVELLASGAGEQRTLKPDDPGWDWIETVTPEFDIQDATLAEFLRWYARERGLDLVWVDEDSETNATATLLAGSIDSASLDESLEIVLEVAPFEHQVSGQKIRVKVE